jgi:hypothetical protein
MRLGPQASRRDPRSRDHPPRRVDFTEMSDGRRASLGARSAARGDAGRRGSPPPTLTRADGLATARGIHTDAEHGVGRLKKMWLAATLGPRSALAQPPYQGCSRPARALWRGRNVLIVRVGHWSNLEAERDGLLSCSPQKRSINKRRWDWFVNGRPSPGQHRTVLDRLEAIHGGAHSRYLGVGSSSHRSPTRWGNNADCFED